MTNHPNRGNRSDCIGPLVDAGIAYHDATALRRISMTLHRWHELECGDGNDYASWCISRGKKDKGGAFEYDEAGRPYLERHAHTENGARYSLLPDRERGALKRLAEIVAKYPAMQAYVQGDPRGAALYIIRKDDIPAGADIDSCYSRGLAVYK